MFAISFLKTRLRKSGSGDAQGARFLHLLRVTRRAARAHHGHQHWQVPGRAHHLHLRQLQALEAPDAQALPQVRKSNIYDLKPSFCYNVDSVS